ncbi:hypothetical protein DWX10_15945 [Clostridium sp. AF18-27]|uniref:hypothetical protein n=1 Tax=Enterocloster lavalensis TaxID=460384 RepID=UPI000E520FAA|nr:hypothetical protein [Enterocloster lavalensis]RHR51911.1 hypothetical protein DWX10_15945 [Clostridium sp. AF18-27]
MADRKRFSILYKGIFVITLCRLLFNFVYGFRWPSEYVCSQNVFTYRYGFLPRALIGTIMQIIFGDNMYSYKANYVIAIGTALILLGWFIWRVYDLALKKRCLAAAVIIFWYSLSIYSAYSAHEMGYFEQYGYLLIILYIELLCRWNFRYMWFLGAVLSFLAVLISETNLFVICPVIFFIGLAAIMNRTGKLSINNIVFYTIWYIPSGLLGIFCNKYQTSAFTIASLLSDLRKFNPSYKYAAGLGKLMLQNRIYWEAQERNDGSIYLPFSFEVIPWQIMLFIIVLLLFVSVFLWMTNRKEAMILYLTGSTIMLLAAYSINFIALDLDRFRYCGVMMILFYSFFLCLEEKKVPLAVETPIIQTWLLASFIIGTILVLVMMDFRLSLFENSIYNENFMILKETIKSIQW